jgi:hypothetical protein
VFFGLAEGFGASTTLVDMNAVFVQVGSIFALESHEDELICFLRGDWQ